MVSGESQISYLLTFSDVGMEANQDCTIPWYKKSMLVFEITKFSKYRVIPGHSNWQINTAVWKLAGFFPIISLLLRNTLAGSKTWVQCPRMTL